MNIHASIPTAQPHKPTHPQPAPTTAKHQVLVGCESGVALYDALTHALSKALSSSSSPLASPSPAGDTAETVGRTWIHMCTCVYMCRCVR